MEAAETTAGEAIRHDPFQFAGRGPADTHWWVECADPFGRCRAMNVVVRKGRIVVVAPPGESAVLSADQTRLLGGALAKAAASTAPDPVWLEDEQWSP